MARNKYWKKFINIASFLLLFILFSCSKKYNSYADSKVIGHGGMGVSSTYPMNSLESLLKALNLDADGVEIDVQMTVDGVLVAFHDEFLDDRSSGTGKINERYWESISDLYYTNYPYLSYKVISLEQILEQLKAYHPLIILDIKNTYAYDEDMANLFDSALNQVLTTYEEEIHFILESKEAEWLSNMQNQFPEISTLLYGYDFWETKEMVAVYDLDGMAIELAALNEVEPAIIQNVDFEISVFNVHNKSQNKTSLDLNIDYIQTENIQQLLRLRGKS